MSELDPTKLSEDAQIILACHFMFGTKAKLTFQTPWNMSPRAQDAFAELIATGHLTKTTGDEGRYADTYRMTEASGAKSSWMMRLMESEAAKMRARGFNVMVPSNERREKPPRGWATQSRSTPIDEGKG